MELRCLLGFALCTPQQALTDGLIVRTVVPVMFPSNCFSNKRMSRKNWTWVCLELSMLSLKKGRKDAGWWADMIITIFRHLKGLLDGDLFYLELDGGRRL